MGRGRVNIRRFEAILGLGRSGIEPAPAAQAMAGAERHGQET